MILVSKDGHICRDINYVEFDEEGVISIVFEDGSFIKANMDDIKRITK